jgi:hypothetical protein
MVALSVVIAALASAAAASERKGPRAVIELFTSQGCSSCPAADKLIGELANDPSIIAMSLSIDYWDYLGWKDTLALPGHANRQRAYAKVRGDREVYTPQAVVNGVAHALGSDRAAIERAIAQIRRPNTLAVPVKLSRDGDKLTVSVPGTSETASGEFWLCPISSRVSVAIGRGENRGRTITYFNVVRRWIRLGDWNGEARTFHVPVNDFAGPDVDAVAVVLQEGTAKHPGVMLGAAQAALR